MSKCPHCLREDMHTHTRIERDDDGGLDEVAGFGYFQLERMNNGAWTVILNGVRVWLDADGPITATDEDEIDDSMLSTDGHTTSDDFRTTYENGIPVNDGDSADNQPEQGYDASEWDDYEPPEHPPDYYEPPEHPPDACAALVFNLDSYEGERRMRECLDAPKWKIAIQEFDYWLRNKIKYEEHDVVKIETYDDARSELHHVFENHGIDLWED